MYRWLALIGNFDLLNRAAPRARRAPAESHVVMYACADQRAAVERAKVVLCKAAV